MHTYKIHFFRHGLTQANLDGTYLGRTDYPLCSQGMVDLVQFAKDKTYPYVDQIYTAPLERCRQTAQILFPQRRPMEVEAFCELDFGAFEGKTLLELKDDPAFEAWSRDSMHNPPPQGENGEEFIRRIVRGIDLVFQDMMDNGYREVAAVVPGGLIMMALALMGFPRRPMEDWKAPGGAGYTVLLTPELWVRDRIFEVMGTVPLTQQDLEERWDTKKYYEDGEEMFFE